MLQITKLNRYIESAIYYAQTQNSFEEICLKYLELGDVTALRTFLTYKLNSLDPDKVRLLFLNTF